MDPAVGLGVPTRNVKSRRKVQICRHGSAGLEDGEGRVHSEDTDELQDQAPGTRTSKRRGSSDDLGGQGANSEPHSKRTRMKKSQPDTTRSRSHSTEGSSCITEEEDEGNRPHGHSDLPSAAPAQQASGGGPASLRRGGLEAPPGGRTSTSTNSADRLAGARSNPHSTGNAPPAAAAASRGRPDHRSGPGQEAEASGSGLGPRDYAPGLENRSLSRAGSPRQLTMAAQQLLDVSPFVAAGADLTAASLMAAQQFGLAAEH